MDGTYTGGSRRIVVPGSMSRGSQDFGCGYWSELENLQNFYVIHY